MIITKKQIYDAGFKYKELAEAVGVVPSRITAIPENQPLSGDYMFKLLFGNNGKKHPIYVKTIKYINSKGQI